MVGVALRGFAVVHARGLIREAALLVCWEPLPLSPAHDGLAFPIRLQRRTPRSITGALVLDHADPVGSRAFPGNAQPQVAMISLARAPLLAPRPLPESTARLPA